MKRSSMAASAAEAIANNRSFNILKRPKFASVIEKTVVTTFSNGLGKIEWYDGEGGEVAFHIGELNFDEYPIIGEKIDVEKPKRYSESQNKRTQKYIKNNYDEIKIRVPKGAKEEYKALAGQNGMSLNQFIVKLLIKAGE